MSSEDKTQDQLWHRYEERLLEAIAVTETALSEWNSAAGEAKQLYRDIAHELTEVRKNVNISKITGSSTSRGIGVPLMAAGAIALPFTFGLSGILIGVGAGVSITGGLVAGGASLTEFGIRQNRMKEIEDKKMQLRLKDLTNALLERYNSLRAVLLEGAKHLDNPDSPFQLNDEHTDRFLVVDGSKMIGVANVVSAGSEVGLAVSNVVGRAMCGSVFAAAVAGIDIYTIVTSSINMAEEGNSDDAIDNLKSSANKLDELCPHIQAVIRRAKESLNGDAKGIIYELMDTYRCCVCLEVAQPPSVACPTCKSFLGCEHCLLKWLNQGSSCPLCRAQWNPDYVTLNRVHGADEFLKHLHMLEID